MPTAVGVGVCVPTDLWVVVVVTDGVPADLWVVVVVGGGVVFFFFVEVSHPLQKVVVELLLLSSQLTVQPRLSFSVGIGLTTVAVVERVSLDIKTTPGKLLLLLLR